MSFNKNNYTNKVDDIIEKLYDLRTVDHNYLDNLEKTIDSYRNEVHALKKENHELVLVNTNLVKQLKKKNIERKKWIYV